MEAKVVSELLRSLESLPLERRCKELQNAVLALFDAVAILVNGIEAVKEAVFKRLDVLDAKSSKLQRRNVELNAELDAGVRQNARLEVELEQLRQQSAFLCKKSVHPKTRVQYFLKNFFMRSF